ncbi:MAG: AgmX/PglI C-terminal domain-containing protein [Deltaproteobacteria bacterium]|nr:AgmX/PglI C-terminal domain-containing protein [Deltaproteobacteria bacterium]
MSEKKRKKVKENKRQLFFESIKGYLIAIVVLVLMSVATYLGMNFKKGQNAKKLSVTTEGETIQDNQATPYITISVNNRLYKNSAEFQKVFNGYLELDPRVKKGSITLIWKINAAGEVGAVAIKSSDFDAMYLTDRLIESLRKVRFPPPPGNSSVKVIHQFDFGK